MVEFLYEPQQLQLTCTLHGDFKSAECAALSDAISGKIVELAGPAGELPDSCRIVLEMTKVDYISSLFLRIVQQAQTQRLETAGTTAVGEIAGFLGETQDGKAVLDALVKTEPATPPPPVAPPTPEPAGVDQNVLGDLTTAAPVADGAPEPPVGTAPSVSPPPLPGGRGSSSRPSADVDRSVLDDLTGDGSKKGRA